METELEKIIPSTEEEEEMEKEEGSETEEDEKEEEQDDKSDVLLPDDEVEGERQPEVLNLNNEVVKMRKEVKRVRALIIRKLTRQIAALKKKKGKEKDVERNQRRAARLLEEVHAMKALAPDVVTKTALQKNLSFEQVCKNPKSTMSDRAVARISTHPQFNNRIENLKAAVKSFKEKRVKGGKREGKEKVQNQTKKVALQSPEKSKERENENRQELKELADGEEGVVKDSQNSAAVKVENEAVKETYSSPSKTQLLKAKTTSVRSSTVKDTVKSKLQSKSAVQKPALQADEKESDLESSQDEEEKEYFDDSTEERFHKQSSQSEDSDSDDDFFVGKVSKFKKKKKQKDTEVKEEADKTEKQKKSSADEAMTSDKLQCELNELESRLKSKPTKLQSVFCSSLTGEGRGVGRGRGGDKFRNPKGRSGPNRDFSKPPKFQKQAEDTEKNSLSKYSKPCPEDRPPESGKRGFGRGQAGDGRGNAVRQRDHRGRGVFPHQAPQPALHPSWEASKKRKAQQGQILAFQGKKTRFDDDDDDD
ncbi:serum response factor-binding protein 1 isoform 2-T2 [Pholidichthys leucotaenia]